MLWFLTWMGSQIFNQKDFWNSQVNKESEYVIHYFIVNTLSNYQWNYLLNVSIRPGCYLLEEVYTKVLGASLNFIASCFIQFVLIVYVVLYTNELWERIHTNYPYGTTSKHRVHCLPVGTNGFASVGKKYQYFYRGQCLGCRCIADISVKNNEFSFFFCSIYEACEKKRVKAKHTKRRVRQCHRDKKHVWNFKELAA